MKSILEEDTGKILENSTVNDPNVEKEVDTEGNLVLNKRPSEGNSGVQDKETVPTDNSCVSVIEKELRRQGITMNDLAYDSPRLSLDWQPFRGVTQCSCATPIDFLTRKVRQHFA